MRVAVLTANLGGFDTPIDPVEQELPKDVEMVFHRFTDSDFPPITGLTGRFQYRIPKLFGWQMFPGYDYYLWFDSSMSLQHKHSVQWFLKQCEESDVAFFKHPWRKTMQEEVEHIELKLEEGSPYILNRYKNGLHRDMLNIAKSDPQFVDEWLFTSTAFVYKNTEPVQKMLKEWWYYQSRYYTCDQVPLPYALFKSNLLINIMEENQFKTQYITLVSHHK